MRFEFKKSTNIVPFDGAVLALAALFVMPTKTSLVLGSLVSLVGILLCLWSKRYKFSRKNFAADGPYVFVRYPYLLGHFIFVFGCIITTRSFAYLLSCVVLLGYAYGKIIKYSEKSTYDNADADYIHYKSSVPAFIPQLVPFRLHNENTTEKIDFFSILVNDHYTEMIRIFGASMLLVTSIALQHFPQAQAAKYICSVLVATIYMYRFSIDFRGTGHPKISRR